MGNQYCKRLQPAITLRSTGRIRPAAARAARALGVALEMLGADARFVPLGDNCQLLAELANETRRARL
jgi:hypothetical protein